MLVCAVWVILDVVKQKWTTGKKAIWIVAAIIFNILTAIVYFFMVKQKK
jgi:hypothetical protein